MFKRLINKLFPSYRKHIVAEYEAGQSTNNIVRHALKGIGTGTVAIDELPIDQRIDLLAEAKTLQKNETFKRVRETLIAEQVDLSVKEAKSVEELNFGRATINGIILFSEEIDRLSSLHDEQSKREEEYDKYEVL